MTMQEIQPSEIHRGDRVKIMWDGGFGPGSAEGVVRRVRRSLSDPGGVPDDFQVQVGDSVRYKVYTDHRRPPVEKIEKTDDGKAVVSSVGRLSMVGRDD